MKKGGYISFFNSLLRTAKTNGFLLDPVSIVLLLLTCLNFVSRIRAGLPLQAENVNFNYIKEGLDLYGFLMLFIDTGFENMLNIAQCFSVNYKFLNCHTLG